MTLLHLRNEIHLRTLKSVLLIYTMAHYTDHSVFYADLHGLKGTGKRCTQQDIGNRSRVISSVLMSVTELQGWELNDLSDPFSIMFINLFLFLSLTKKGKKKKGQEKKHSDCSLQHTYVIRVMRKRQFYKAVWRFFHFFFQISECSWFQPPSWHRGDSLL